MIFAFVILGAVSQAALAFHSPLRSRLHTLRMQSTTSNRSSSLENIGLFASADRKPKPSDKPGSTLIPPVKAGISSEVLSAEAELLRLEAEREQLAIDRERIQKEKRILEDIDNLILKLLDVDSTAEYPYDTLIQANKKLIRKDLFFRLVELSNIATGEEKVKFTKLSDSLMSAVGRLDPPLYASVTADIEKELASELDRLKTGQREKDAENVRVYDQVLQQWIQQTVGNRSDVIFNNMTLPEMANRAMIRFPSAVPLILLPLMLRAPETSAQDVEVLKNKVFTPDLLNNTIIDYATFITTFRGKPYASMQQTINTINERLEETGLASKVCCSSIDISI